MKSNISKIAATAGWVALCGTLLSGAASAKQTVELGFIGPLTGGVSSLGIGGRNSAQLAIDLHNADPKSKYTFKLDAEDSQCSPSAGVQAATKLAANPRVIGAVAHYCSAVAMATVDIYHRFKLPVTVWGAVLPDITYGNDYPEITRVNGTMINQNETAAKLMTSLGYKTWAIIHDTTDYGNGHDKYFTKDVTADGGKILADIGVTADQQDFTAELTKIKQLNPEVLYFAGLTPEAVRIRQQMEKLGLKAVFQGVSGIKSDAYFQGVGEKMAEGTVTFLEGAPAAKLPGGAMFMAAYQKAGFKDQPEAYGPFAFAAMNLLMSAVEANGPDRKAVMAYMAKVKDHKSIIGPISFDAHGQNTVAAITAYVAQDGKWVVWQDSEYASGKRKLPGQK